MLDILRDDEDNIATQGKMRDSINSKDENDMNFHNISLFFLVIMI